MTVRRKRTGEARRARTPRPSAFVVAFCVALGLSLLAGPLAAPLGGTQALAVLPDEVLDDPALEARARALSRQLRCMVCQNESIDESHADLARDLRLLVRERLVAGDSDHEVLSFMTARYGDFVLLRPPMAPRTWALWFGPGIILLLATAGLLLAVRRRRGLNETTIPLSDDERRRLERILGTTDENDAGPAPRGAGSGRDNAQDPRP